MMIFTRQGGRRGGMQIFIIYAFAALDNVTNSIQSGDSELDTEEDGGKGNK